MEKNSACSSGRKGSGSAVGGESCVSWGRPFTDSPEESNGFRDVAHLPTCCFLTLALPLVCFDFCQLCYSLSSEAWYFIVLCFYLRGSLKAQKRLCPEEAGERHLSSGALILGSGFLKGISFWPSQIPWKVSP